MGRQEGRALSTPGFLGWAVTLHTPGSEGTGGPMVTIFKGALAWSAGSVHAVGRHSTPRLVKRSLGLAPNLHLFSVQVRSSSYQLSYLGFGTSTLPPSTANISDSHGHTYGHFGEFLCKNFDAKIFLQIFLCTNMFPVRPPTRNPRVVANPVAAPGMHL